MMYDHYQQCPCSFKYCEKKMMNSFKSTQQLIDKPFTESNNHSFENSTSFISVTALYDLCEDKQQVNCKEEEIKQMSPLRKSTKHKGGFFKDQKMGGKRMIFNSNIMQSAQQEKQPYSKNIKQSSKKLQYLSADNTASQQINKVNQQQNTQTEFNLDNEKEINYFLKHMFKYHYENEKNTFEFQILKCYYVLYFQKNPHLASFLLIDMMMNENYEQKQKNNIISKNIKQIHLYQFQQVIAQQSKGEETLLLKTIDFDKMLKANQLMSRFDLSLEQVTEEISMFWKYLQSEKQSQQIYQKGLMISKGIDSLGKVYLEMEQGLGNQIDFKIYLSMAAFYKFVIFKNKEHFQEMQKFRQTITTKRIQVFSYQREQDREKGLLMSKFDSKNNMDILFINKVGLKISNYNSNEVVNLKINALMPEIISDNHSLIIQRFLKTGKNKLINQQLPMFLKQKHGYILPVNLYLFPNSQNCNYMVLLFDKETIEMNKQIADDEQDSQNLGTILTDDQLNIYELTQSIEHNMFVTKDLLDYITSLKGSSRPNIEDIFECSENELEIAQFLSKGLEIQVTVKYVNYLYQMSTTNDNAKRHNSFQFESLENHAFVLKCKKLHYLKGKVVINQIDIFYYSNGIQSHFNLGGRSTLQSKISGQQRNQILSRNEAGDLQNQQSIDLFQEMSDDSIREFELSSQSASTTTSSTLSSIMSSFTKLTTQMDQNKLPLTLKFILQILLTVFLLVILTSVISLVLTMLNFNNASRSIVVSKAGLQRLNNLRVIRVILRNMINIANDISINSNDLIDNRFDYYNEVAIEILNEMKLNTDYLYVQNDFDQNAQINLTYLDSNNKLYNQQHLGVQAFGLYISYINDMLQNCKTQGQQYLQTTNNRINIKYSHQKLSKASQADRVMYFIVYNQNQNIYNTVRGQVRTFNTQKLSDINNKIGYLNTMTMICIGVVFFCGLILLPLFTRIYQRILQLMKLFFTIEKQKIRETITSIHKFQETFKYVQQLDKDPAFVDIQEISNHSQDQPQNEKENEEIEQIDESARKQSQQRKSSIIDVIKGIKAKSSNNKLIEKNQNELKSEAEEIEQEVEESKKPKLIMKQSQIEIAFQRYIQKKKIVQSLVIMVLTCLIASYFISFYFMTQSTFNEIQININITNFMYSRKTSLENVFQGIQEPYSLNQSIIINTNKDEFQYYITRGMEDEESYQETIIRSGYHQLQPLQEYITGFEDSRICDLAFPQNRTLSRTEDPYFFYNVTNHDCKTKGNGVVMNGLTNFMYQTYQYSYQELLSFKVQKNRSYSLIKDRLSNEFPYYMDITIKYLSKPSDELNLMTTNVITDYTNALLRSFIYLFIAFVFILLTILLVFICSKFIILITVIQKYSRT